VTISVKGEDQFNFSHSSSQESQCQQGQQPKQGGGSEIYSQVAAGPFALLPGQAEEQAETQYRHPYPSLPWKLGGQVTN
jgi:hypothetical protein